MAKTFHFIDLFANYGGLSLGLHKAGWKGLFAIEKIPDAFKTLKHNLIDTISLLFGYQSGLVLKQLIS
jgi:DNA (cytosine-5)-methyltransferase 1